MYIPYRLQILFATNLSTQNMKEIFILPYTPFLHNIRLKISPTKVCACGAISNLNIINLGTEHILSTTSIYFFYYINTYM